MKKFLSLFPLICLLNCSGTDYQNVNQLQPRPYHYSSEIEYSEAEKEFHKELLQARMSKMPNIIFPANFGIARVENGYLRAVPAEEAKIVEKYRNQTKEFGSFTPINTMLLSTISDKYKNDIIKQIRLIAAKQQLDAVIIYETSGSSLAETNILDDIGNLMIVGDYILPAQHIKASGKSHAILIDVMEDYVYGQVSTATKVDTDYTTTSNKYNQLETMKQERQLKAVELLTPKVINMLSNLKKLTEKK